jgi:hypothetical protein
VSTEKLILDQAGNQSTEFPKNWINFQKYPKIFEPQISGQPTFLQLEKLIYFNFLVNRKQASTGNLN